jgi:hypothetical protein
MKIRLKGLLKKELLILYLIIFIGAFLRLQGVFTNSFAFTYDVGRDMLAVRDIVVNHKIPLIGAIVGGNSASDLPGIFYGPWWYYFLTPFFVLSSGNPQGIALAMALIGIVTIVLGFVFGRRLGGMILGLTIALLMSTSSTLIALSAQIWNPDIAPLFVMLILLILINIFKGSKSLLNYFFLGLLLAFCMDIQIIFGIFLSLGIILSLIFIQNRKISIKKVLFFILGSLVIFAPRIVFELRHQLLMTKALLAFFLKGNSLTTQSSLLSTVGNRLSVFFDQFSSTLALGNRILGGTILLFTILTIILLYKKADKQIKNFIKTSLITIVVFIFGTIFISHDIWPHYLVGLPIFYIFLFGVSLYLLGKKLLNNLIPIIIVVVVFLINLNPIALKGSLTKPLWEGDASVYRNQVAVTNYVYEQAKGKDFKYVVYTPPLYDYTYQYLFLWYGPKKYHYLPLKQSKLAFFILEPDLQLPSRLIDWLKLREGDGKIIKSEEVKGGIIVQTRINK